MKKIFYSILLSGMMVLSACDALDLSPEDYYGSNDFWNQKSQVEMFMTGIHADLRDKYQMPVTLGEFRRGKLAEDHRSRTCPGPLAAPTGFEVQPPHRRRRSSAPRLLHGGGAHYSYFLEFLHPPDQFFPPNTRSVLSRKHYSSYKTHILQ